MTRAQTLRLGKVPLCLAILFAVFRFHLPTLRVASAVILIGTSHLPLPSNAPRPRPYRPTLERKHPKLAVSPLYFISQSDAGAPHQSMHSLAGHFAAQAAFARPCSSSGRCMLSTETHSGDLRRAGCVLARAHPLDILPPLMATLADLRPTTLACARIRHRRARNSDILRDHLGAEDGEQEDGDGMVGKGCQPQRHSSGTIRGLHWAATGSIHPALSPRLSALLAEPLLLYSPTPFYHPLHIDPTWTPPFRSLPRARHEIVADACAYLSGMARIDGVSSSSCTPSAHLLPSLPAWDASLAFRHAPSAVCPPATLLMSTSDGPCSIDTPSLFMGSILPRHKLSCHLVLFHEGGDGGSAVAAADMRLPRMLLSSDCPVISATPPASSSLGAVLDFSIYCPSVPGVAPSRVLFLLARTPSHVWTKGATAGVRASGREQAPPGAVLLALLYTPTCHEWTHCLAYPAGSSLFGRSSARHPRLGFEARRPGYAVAAWTGRTADTPEMARNKRRAAAPRPPSIQILRNEIHLSFLLFAHHAPVSPRGALYSFAAAAAVHTYFALCPPVTSTRHDHCSIEVLHYLHRPTITTDARAHAWTEGTVAFVS
ncbi:hypothetical protein DFH08DRAFT_1089236 [Mycena albidolilacea]|uniref:Uncharacterized protein n=1 Tax=Mycena albidolilacea TaxID=1033008 RepID=A0AAD6Z1Y2_9AGAR|nr:hypothetical protein DFH08DRAFT_1089236 [Mycena albidolilacea]